MDDKELLYSLLLISGILCMGFAIGMFFVENGLLGIITSVISGLLLGACWILDKSEDYEIVHKDGGDKNNDR